MRVVVVRFGMGCMLAAALVRCDRFGSTSDAVGPDAAVEDAALDASYERTGVACGAGDALCAVGEKCCGGLPADAATSPVCSADCASVGAKDVFECGRSSDCPSGHE